MVTLKDIAAEAGVSITTVSNVVHNRKSRVSPELVRKIEKIIQREHYAPSMSARSLANDQSNIIGVITHLTPQNTGSTMGDPFLSSFVDSVEKHVREEGYYLMFRAVEDAMELASLSRSWRLAGLILTGMFQDEFFSTIRELGIPYVLIDSYVDDPGACCIGLEDEQGGYIATKHLLEKGHRTIAFASPSIRRGGVIGDIVDEDIIAQGREFDADRPADSPASAGHECILWHSRSIKDYKYTKISRLRATRTKKARGRLKRKVAACGT